MAPRHSALLHSALKGSFVTEHKQQSTYVTFSITTVCIDCHFDECHYAECHDLFIVMLNVIMLNEKLLIRHSLNAFKI